MKGVDWEENKQLAKPSRIHPEFVKMLQDSKQEYEVITEEDTPE